MIKQATVTSTIVILPKRQFNYNLEFLRGVAALLVICGHTIVHKLLLDPGYTPSGIWTFAPPGHLSVLVFFVLSGYVIGLTNPVPLVGSTIGTYLKKRFLRIFPGYALSIVVAWLIAYPKYALAVLGGSLMFLQIVWLTPIVWENNPTWSLYLEIVFYLLFVPVSFFRINYKILTALTIIIPLLLLFVFNAPTSTIPSIYGAYTPTSTIPTIYSVFLCFWLAGVLISVRYRHAEVKKVNYAILLSSVFALISLEYFNVLQPGLTKILEFIRPYSPLSDANWQARASSLKEFGSLPLCVLIILFFAGAKNRFFYYGYYLLVALNSLTFIYIFRHRFEPVIYPFVIPSLVYIASVLLLFFQGNQQLNTILEKLMQRGAALGKISYGIYIIHFPILVLFSKVHVVSGSAITFNIRFVLFVGMTLAASYLLERKMQPFIVRLFTGK